MNARHHHYLSQFYLKGFTKDGSKLTVIDFKEKKKFETSPRNVGGIRDFNQIRVQGVNPNIIESSFADFEVKVAESINNVTKSLNFVGQDRNNILEFIALLAARSPEKRENGRQLIERIIEKILNLLTATEERWKLHVEQMKTNGYKPSENISYEGVKKICERKSYSIQVSREHHIKMEMVAIKAILPYLHARKWLIIQATKETGFFITSDNPVNLVYKNKEKIPPLFRNSPGFGMPDTQLYFPISSEIALLGEFEGQEGLVNGTQEFISLLNSKMIIFAYKQIYSPEMNFYFSDYFVKKNGKICKGEELINTIIGISKVI
jgi:hypothetical protein